MSLIFAVALGVLPRGCRVAPLVLLLVFFFSLTRATTPELLEEEGMPHKWSPAKLLERRERAVRLGFCQRREFGYRHVQVEQSIVGRVRFMVKGVAATREMELKLGVHRRFASQLVPLVKRAEGDVSAEAFAAKIRSANCAKHASFMKVLNTSKLVPGSSRPTTNGVAPWHEVGLRLSAALARADAVEDAGAPSLLSAPAALQDLCFVQTEVRMPIPLRLFDSVLGHTGDEGLTHSDGLNTFAQSNAQSDGPWLAPGIWAGSPAASGASGVWHCDLSAVHERTSSFCARLDFLELRLEHFEKSTKEQLADYASQLVHLYAATDKLASLVNSASVAHTETSALVGAGIAAVSDKFLKMHEQTDLTIADLKLKLACYHVDLQMLQEGAATLAPVRVAVETHEQAVAVFKQEISSLGESFESMSVRIGEFGVQLEALEGKLGDTSASAAAVEDGRLNIEEPNMNCSEAKGVKRLAADEQFFECEELPVESEEMTSDGQSAMCETSMLPYELAAVDVVEAAAAAAASIPQAVCDAATEAQAEKARLRFAELSSVNDVYAYEIGEAVTLCGLRAGGFNGQVGRITAYPNAQGRYSVRLFLSQEIKAVLPKNILQGHRGELFLCTKCGCTFALMQYGSECGCGDFGTSSTQVDPNPLLCRLAVSNSCARIRFAPQSLSVAAPITMT